MKKRSKIVNEFKELAKIVSQMDSLDIKYTAVEKKFLSQYKKLTKKVGLTKTERSKIYSDYRKVYNQRIQRFKKILDL
mgnify:CR=1 FL=1